MTSNGACDSTAPDPASACTSCIKVKDRALIGHVQNLPIVKSFPVRTIAILKTRLAAASQFAEG